MKKIVVATLLTLTCIALPLMAQANIVMDPGFTNGVVGSGGATLYDSGWFVKEGLSNAAVTWANDPTGGPDGSQCVVATPGSNPGGRTNMSSMRQWGIDPATSPAGVPYVLEFDYKMIGPGWSTDGTNEMASHVSRVEVFVIQCTGANSSGSMWWDGTTYMIGTETDGWQHAVYNFTPRNDPDFVTQSFAFKFQIGFSDYLTDDVFYVDNVSLAAVPEPGSIISLLSGVAGMGLMVVRRKRA